MQNSKTVAQTLLGETAPLGFCPPKIGPFRGVGGVPKFFFFIGNFIFLLLGSPCKNLKSYDNSFLEIEQTAGNSGGYEKKIQEAMRRRFRRL